MSSSLRTSSGLCAVLVFVTLFECEASAQLPARTEVVEPIHNETFDRNGKTRAREQGGNPREVDGLLVFDGATDGNRQVDPQIAVGGGYVLHATNLGLVIYDKKGHYVKGVPQSGFNGGIDPKLFFDPHNRVFGFDLWNPWDKAKKKPVNISVSETSDPTGSWNTYPVPAPQGRDGGGIGFSKKWIGYSFPGGSERTFVMKMSTAKAGKPATVYHFAGTLGHPVATQDDVEDLYFVKVGRREITVVKVTEREDGTPEVEAVGSPPHALVFNRRPPRSPQKGTDQQTASGDRNPKNLVLQGGHIWFSQAVRCAGRSAVQWVQIKTDGTVVQRGLIRDGKSSFIQTTIAVNKNLDVLVGFQETSADMFISPRLAIRHAADPPGELRPIVKLGEGRAATNGTSWGDYSGSTIDGDNLLDLWTVQSIADETGRGDTVIVRVPFAKASRAEPPAWERAGIPNPAVIAHRGASYYAPEETAAAFRLAGELGVDYFELDLQRTKDGALIALHDGTLGRTTNVEDVFPERAKQPVSAFTLEELRRLDAGSWFNEKHKDRARAGFVGQKIPTLAEIVAIAAALPKKPALYIETKRPDLFPGIEKDLAAELKRLGWYEGRQDNDRLLLQTFSAGSLEKLRESFPDAPLVWLLSFRRNEQVTAASVGAKLEIGARQRALGIGASGRILRNALITTAIAKAGLCLHPYTINDVEGYRSLEVVGAHGFFTDRPDLLRDHYGRSGPGVEESLKKLGYD